MKNMRVCFTEPFTVALQWESLPAQLESDQLLVRTLFSLISPGTELALYTHTHVGFKDPNNLWAKYPFYPGYTAVGIVEKVGTSVQEYQSGDLIFYFGGHQLYSILSTRESLLFAVPAELPLTWVPFTRMAQIAYTAVLVSGPPVGKLVAVMGLGLVGNFAAQLFKLNGAEVLGVDLIPARGDIARRCGIDRIIGADQPDSVLAVKAATGNVGAHVVVEATGNPILIDSALRMACPLGEVILLGSPRGKVEVDVYSLIHRTGVALKGAHEVLFPKLADRCKMTQQILQQIQNKQLVVEPLISQIVSPQQMEESYQALLYQKEKVIGILVDWSQV